MTPDKVSSLSTIAFYFVFVLGISAVGLATIAIYIKLFDYFLRLFRIKKAFVQFICESGRNRAKKQTK